MELVFNISDGTQVRGEMIKPSGSCRGSVVIIHGLGEHFGRYRQWAGRFADAGYAVCGADLPGHGMSGGRRGHMASFMLAGEIIETLIESCRKECEGLPVILYGHSLGGGIVLHYLLSKKPDICCAVVTSPWLKLSFEPSGFKIWLAGVMRRIAPSMVQPSGLVVGHISRDPAVVDEYRADPLVHDRISVALFNETVGAAAYSLANASRLTVPLLLMHGGGDMITSPEGSRQFAGSAPGTDLRIWDGGFHELHNDIVKEEVFGYLAGWLSQQTAKDQASLS
ncbi:MAG: alpha/beta hydrolase [Bacteroidales bacterium]|jgi:alpha-beta hydrolase superfamily lysophospholipase|nr:alpha/beta hydrolase [Bacteroidales bacterium]